MKRNYTKPQIAFDDFTLTTNIAAGCGRIVDNPTNGTCGVPWTGIFSGYDYMLFNSVTSGCAQWVGIVERAIPSYERDWCFSNLADEVRFFNSL